MRSKASLFVLRDEGDTAPIDFFVILTSLPLRLTYMVYNSSMARVYSQYDYSYITQKREKHKYMLLEALGGSCLECGSTKNLQFDHIIPNTKNFDISQKLHYSLKILLDELQKCQLLCFDCHRLKTSSDNGWDISRPHGTPSTYTNGKCRCVKCKKAWAQYIRNKRL